MREAGERNLQSLSLAIDLGLADRVLLHYVLAQ